MKAILLARSMISLLLAVLPIRSAFAENQYTLTESRLARPPAGYPIVNGVVRKVDLCAMTLLIKHGEVPNLDMPAMTITFKVTDHQTMQGLAPRDQIRFAADYVSGVLTAI